MDKVKVYLNFDFICAFNYSRPTDYLSGEYSQWLKTCLSLTQNHLELIMINSKSFNETILDKNDFTRFFEGFNSPIRGTINIIDSAKIKDFIKTNYNPHMILLLEMTDDKMEELQCELGVWVMNTSALLQSFLCTKIGIGVPLNVNRKIGHIKSWSYLSQFKHPFGGIIIIDRYFFSSLDYKANLGQILEQLTKHDLTLPLHITIIYQSNYVDKCFTNQALLYNDVSQVCSKIFSPGNFELTIIQVNWVNQTHDRRIITNYMFILSGTSFHYSTNNDPIKVKSNFKTHLTFHDTLTKEAIDDILDDLNYVRNINSERGFQSKGTNINRLVQGQL